VFYILCGDREERTALIQHLKERRIEAVIHYRPLHLSPYYKENYYSIDLPVTEVYSNTLLR
jgi:dTDP-4-amino-4,6-dideoxygalactose transaminase